MRNSLLLLIAFLIIGNAEVFAQASKINKGDIVCPATGTSIQVIAANPGRYSYSINNTSGVDIRLGYAPSGTAALGSTDFLLKAGQPYSDSTPGVYSGRVTCMSTTASTATISFLETYR